MNRQREVLRSSMEVAPEEWLDQLVTERVVALVESQPEAPWLGRLWSSIVRVLPHGAIVRAPRLPRPSA